MFNILRVFILLPIYVRCRNDKWIVSTFVNCTSCYSKRILIVSRSDVMFPLVDILQKYDKESMLYTHAHIYLSCKPFLTYLCINRI